MRALSDLRGKFRSASSYNEEDVINATDYATGLSLPETAKKKQDDGMI